MTNETLGASPETAIRNYLLFLEDPTQLVDHELIEKLTAKVQQAGDPIERLMAYAELERAQRTDNSKYKLDFILHAKVWAEANGVGAAAFRQLGVKDDVLRSAGLVSSDNRRGRKQRREAGSGRSSVSVETIKSYVRSVSGKFTLADVYSGVGGSPMTVRKGVQQLVDAGAVKRLGPSTEWSGRGRAPIVFEVIAR